MKIGSPGHISLKIKSTRASMSTTLGASVLLPVLSIICGAAPSAHALDPIPAHIASGLQAGVVTSVEQRSLFISGKHYTVDPEVEIRDQEDNVLQPEVIKRGHEVRFHLQKGGSNTIDFLIVYMPQ